MSTWCATLFDIIISLSALLGKPLDGWQRMLLFYTKSLQISQRFFIEFWYSIDHENKKQTVSFASKENFPNAEAGGTGLGKPSPYGVFDTAFKE
jgi:hypothetical protein